MPAPLSNFARVVDFVLAIILLILGFALGDLPAPKRFFVERDPTLSYPEEDDMEVPAWLLLIISVLPFALPGLFQLITWNHTEHKVKNALHGMLMYFEVVSTCLFITTVFKVFAGRYRPNFFAMCNYKGYRDALESENFTAYLAATTPGLRGDLIYCLEPNANKVHEAQMSDPSGHSSLAAAACGFLILFWHYNVMMTSKMPSRFGKMVALVPPGLALLCALLVAYTRTRDYWHNYDDIWAGLLIGFGSAFAVFKINEGETGVEWVKEASERPGVRGDMGEVLIQ